MSIETFDQRFKRLTSDMLMIDICRLLGIEIRQLMKIRSGVRVELAMNGLRKLCLEQGLDFNSFVRGYSDPWSSEITTTEVITSDQPVALPAKVTAEVAAKGGNSQKFRADGSRIPQTTPPKRSAPVETVRSAAPIAPPPPVAPIAPVVPKEPALDVKPPEKKIQVTFRPTKASAPPTIPEKYEPEPEDDFLAEDFDSRPSIASRLRDAVTSAFRRNDAQTEQAELYSGVAPARVVTVSGSSESPSEPEPDALAVAHTPLEKQQEREIQTLISEVSSLRREISHLSTDVRQLLER